MKKLRLWRITLVSNPVVDPEGTGLRAPLVEGLQKNVDVAPEEVLDVFFKKHKRKFQLLDL